MSTDQEFSEQQPLEDELSNAPEQPDASSDETESGVDESIVAQESEAGVAEPDVMVKKTSETFAEFAQKFETFTDPEEKIRLAIGFMRAALSQSGSPRFKDFWEGRRLCLPMFKEAINPAKRTQLWGEYIELSSEARRLKEILDEQSAFAAEQIELAIQALEADLDQYNNLLQQTPELELPQQCATIQSKKEFYLSLQKELHLLNTLASRVNALRKEVIKTEMRIRVKNKFFEKLSACGDRIFPRRKELIKQISDEFIKDVHKFIQANFQQEDAKNLPLFVLRDEIKALQSIAKLLTLNTHSFTETRLQLSECWDKVKRREKERKKEFAVKKQVFKQNYDQVMEKIRAFAEVCKQNELSAEELNTQSGQILELMRGLELGRDEVRSLKDELFQAKKPLLERAREEELEKERKDREIEQQRKDKINDLKSQVIALVEQAEQLSAEEISTQRDRLQKEFDMLSSNRAEKQAIERIFKQIKDALIEKKEKAMMNLSEDELHSLEQLKEVLAQRKLWRQEIKNQLETYRKALGGSGFDFEKAMMYSELIETEKARLEKANAAIEEIEEKIEQFENR